MASRALLQRYAELKGFSYMLYLSVLSFMDIGTANGGYICQDVDFELSLKVWEDKVNFKNKGTCKTCWATGEKIYVF